ncbi:MAG: GDSL-type esterase/lipase family protein [Thermodesulfobacteriota bacterium]|nr:GDSL-type esterase/lipase family protein [Thermodesulfobacteriota bacterium]
MVLLLLFIPGFVFGLEVLTMGDSITAGSPYNLHGDGNRVGPYQGDLERILHNNGLPSNVYNWGKSGEMTPDGVNRISNVLSSRSADLILIMEGTNDVTNGISSNTTAANIGIMIDKSISRRVTPIVGTITPNSRPGGFDAVIRDHFNPKIVSKADSRGVKVADQYWALRPRWNTLQYNDLHPNLAGYQIIAETWYGTIFPLPEATSGAAEHIRATAAVVKGIVYPNGSVTKTYFEYGTSTHYTFNSEQATIDAQEESVDVSITLTGLEPFTTYHYRIVATNLGGTAYGDDRTFGTCGALPWLFILLE